MRWKPVSCVRVVTIVLPCLWFLFVGLSLLNLDPTLPVILPRHVTTQPGVEGGVKEKHPQKTVGGRGAPENDPHYPGLPRIAVPAFAERDPGVKSQRGDSNRAVVFTKTHGSVLRRENLRQTAKDKDTILGVKRSGEDEYAGKERGRTQAGMHDQEDPRRNKGILGAVDTVENAGKHGRAHVGVPERGSKREGEKRGGEGGGDHVDRGVVGKKEKEEEEDSYADVTYPPYVETLPAGAKGQGPSGLMVAEDTLPKEQQREYRDKWNKNQFSQYVSDLIPVHRHLPDYRSESCRSTRYPSTLPKMSVVMVFHNEAWSTLLRSVHSVLDRTPHHLLLHIVLVDDFSDMDHLKRPLEKYFLRHPQVKIIRMPKRGGLIQARLRGFEATTAEVVVFLDSHIECTAGWAEPLLWVVAQDYRAVPFPVIDMIDAKKLSYIKTAMSPYGVFSMNSLTFTWSSTLKRTPHPVTGARPSPTMPGGLFAISRKWFEEIGTFDPELEYWGGENMELSFKAWMCGGSIVIADCSHVGHIFRAQNPITWSRPLGSRNYVRVALVWLDDYRNHYLERINYQLGEYGDISQRQALRERLQCHSFDWYVQHVYPELKDQLVLNATYAGEIRHETSGQCLDKLGREQFKSSPRLLPCHQQGGNQFWYFREDRFLQADNKLLCQKGGDSVGLCFGNSPQQQWAYDLTSRQLKHVTSGLCLQTRAEKSVPQDVMLAPCRPEDPRQRWTLQRRKPFKYR